MSEKAAHRRRFAGETPKGCGVEFTGAYLRKPNNHERKKHMHEDLEKVKLLARDLRDGKEFPRSPRATLAGYVLAAIAGRLFLQERISTGRWTGIALIMSGVVLVGRTAHSTTGEPGR